ncbi:MAG: DUF6152 family protein [Vicinamibacterales bacterium]
MRRKLGLLMAGLGFLCAGIPLAAHHSFALEYDGNKPVTLQGVVTKIEWTNPHARIYVDVTDPQGSVSNWNLELASPSALARNGWSSKSVKVGDKVKFEGFEGRAAGTHRANARSIVLADGRSLFSGAATDTR